jgi:1-acyl-sn-glycerol-3-phosphate acyltransferase
VFYWLVKLLFWPFGRTYLRMKISGDVPRKGPLILVANHASWLDPAVLGSACPRAVTFLISRRVYDRRGGRWFYRWMGTIPVKDLGDTDHAALRQTLRALRDGRAVGIFPEGAGLDPAGGLRSPRAGAALIASRSGVPVVPVAIDGTHESMPKGRFFPRPGRIHVRFGEPFTMQSAGGEPPRAAEARRGARQISADDMMRRITEMLEKRA